MKEIKENEDVDLLWVVLVFHSRSSVSLKHAAPHPKEDGALACRTCNPRSGALRARRRPGPHGLPLHGPFRPPPPPPPPSFASFFDTAASAPPRFVLDAATTDKTPSSTVTIVTLSRTWMVKQNRCPCMDTKTTCPSLTATATCSCCARPSTERCTS